MDDSTPLHAADMVSAARARIAEIPPRPLESLPTGAVLIDVREPAEFASGHLPGAVNIPRGLIEFEVETHPAVGCATDPALARRDRTLVLYCRSGGRSALAAEALQRMGFRDVRSIAGGIGAWREAGLPVIMG